MAQSQHEGLQPLSLGTSGDAVPGMVNPAVAVDPLQLYYDS